MIKDQRHNYVMKDFFVPIVVSVMLGCFAAYATVKFNEGETVAWRSSIEKQIIGMEIILKAVQSNQIELASNRQWMMQTESRVNKIEDQVFQIQQNTYSRNDADRDIKQLIREIKIRHGEKTQ